MANHILIVDDNPSVRETVELILSMGNYTVSTADGADQCLALLNQGFKGLIFMDVMMPGLDGWDTIAAIRDAQLLEGNIICMLTAVHDPGPKMESLKECVLDYIKKPFSAEELLAVAANAISYLP
jgi:DNA-binding response OmpR family regulator